VVPTLTFERLFVFLVVGHGRRQLLWFAVTRNPSAEWLAQQMVEAFPWNTAPTYLVRDNHRPNCVAHCIWITSSLPAVYSARPIARKGTP
jgi:hypothetical protein